MQQDVLTILAILLERSIKQAMVAYLMYFVVTVRIVTVRIVTVRIVTVRIVTVRPLV